MVSTRLLESSLPRITQPSRRPLLAPTGGPLVSRETSEEKRPELPVEITSHPLLARNEPRSRLAISGETLEGVGRAKELYWVSALAEVADPCVLEARGTRSEVEIGVQAHGQWRASVMEGLLMPCSSQLGVLGTALVPPTTMTSTLEGFT